MIKRFLLHHKVAFNNATQEFGETGEEARIERKLVSQSSASTQISPAVRKTSANPLHAREVLL
jgi:hypothetical protein